MNEANTGNFSPNSIRREQILIALENAQAPMQERLINLCKTTEVPEDEYTEAAHGIVETVVILVGSGLKGTQAFFEEQYTTLSQKLNEANTQQADLVDRARNALQEAKEDPIFMFVIEGLLMLGMMLVMATALRIVQPELPWWVTPFQAIVIVGSSLFGSFLYKHIQQKSRFCKWLAIIGIVLIALTSVSCAISKGLFYHMAGSGLSITGTTSSWQDKVQLFFSISTFFTLVLSEFALATLLGISIVTARESQKPLECAKEELNIVTMKVTQLVPDVADLGQYVSVIRAFDDIAEPWQRQALIILIRECQAAQEELRGIGQPANFL